MATHNFEEQLARGQRGEGDLDFLFSTLGYKVVPASATEQRLGIDRHLTPPGWERAVTVEYKTDFHRTDNAFVETVSVSGKRLGWAFTSQAQYLAYAMPAHSRVWVIPLGRLRERLPDWLRRYPKRDVLNEGYTTQGLLVPLKEFDAIALRVYLVTQA